MTNVSNVVNVRNMRAITIFNPHSGMCMFLFLCLLFMIIDAELDMTRGNNTLYSTEMICNSRR